MSLYRLLKVQTPALRLRWPPLGRTRRERGDLLFGAHNFIAVMQPDGRTLQEMHGIARGAGGAPLRIYGGVLPFRREVIWGEVFPHRTGFYDPGYPQGVLFEGPWTAVAPLLDRAEAVRAAVNAAEVGYPWPAFAGANSNAYYRWLLAGMGLEDVRVDGQLWAPGHGRSCRLR